VVARTSTGELVDLDPDTGQTTVLLDQGPYEFRLAYGDPRFVLVEDRSRNEDGIGWGRQLTVDREHAVVHELTPPQWLRSMTIFEGDAFVVVPLVEENADRPTEIVFVPGFEHRSFAAPWRVPGRLDDGRRLLSRTDLDGETLFVLDDPQAEPKAVYASDRPFSVRIVDGEVLVSHAAHGARRTLLDCPTLLRIALVGGDPQPVAVPACGELQLPGGWFVGVGWSDAGNQTGPMMLVDPDGERARVADFVEDPLRYFNDPVAWFGDPLPDADWLYVVREPGGTGNGLWGVAIESL
jgi:hypothetical protein